MASLDKEEEQLLQSFGSGLILTGSCYVSKDKKNKKNRTWEINQLKIMILALFRFTKSRSELLKNQIRSFGQMANRADKCKKAL